MFSSILKPNLATRLSRVIAKITRQFSAEADLGYLNRPNGNRIAYRALVGRFDKPGVIFCAGFQSNMRGVKARALEEYCKKNELSYVRFDYQGCGDSSGDIRDVTFSDWKEDVTAILDNVTAGPQILVGSSMGAWLAIHTAMARPHRIHSLVGVASAVDFSQRSASRFSSQALKDLDETGETTLESEYGSYIITKKFMEDISKLKHNIFTKDQVPIICPARFLHGMQDASVPYQTSIKLAEKLQSQDVLVVLRKKGDHRLSQPEDIQILFEELDYLVMGSNEAKRLAITSWAAFSVFKNPPQEDS